MRTSFFLIVLTVLLISSCDNSSFDHYQTQEINGSWMFTDTLMYEFSDQEIENADLQVEIEHSNDFKYENIYLALIGTDNEKKVFSISLVNNKGQWQGKQNGKSYLIKKSVSGFNLEKEKIIKIIHQAREDELEGIVSVSMGLVKKSN